MLQYTPETVKIAMFRLTRELAEAGYPLPSVQSITGAFIADGLLVADWHRVVEVKRLTTNGVNG